MSKNPQREQFYYNVYFTQGGHVQVTADEQLLGAGDAGWFIFYNRDVEVFRYRVAALAGWLRVAKPGVTD